MRVFEALERLIGARPGQKLDVNFRAAFLEQTVHRASRRLAFGLMGGFAVLSSALTAMSDRVDVWVSVVFGLVGAGFTLALIVDLLRRDGHLGRIA